MQASGVSDEAEAVEVAARNLRSRNVMSKQMRTDGGMKNAHHSIWHASEEQTLAGCKASLASLAPPAAPTRLRAAPRSRGAAPCAAFVSAPRKRSSGSLLGSLLPSWLGGKKEALTGPPVSEAEFECAAEAQDRMHSDSEEGSEAGMLCAAMPPAPPAAAATSNALVEDFISVEQVSRMHMKSKFRA